MSIPFLFDTVVIEAGIFHKHLKSTNREYIMHEFLPTEIFNRKEHDVNILPQISTCLFKIASPKFGLENRKLAGEYL